MSSPSATLPSTATSDPIAALLAWASARCESAGDDELIAAARGALRTNSARRSLDLLDASGYTGRFGVDHDGHTSLHPDTSEQVAAALALTDDWREDGTVYADGGISLDGGPEMSFRRRWCLFLDAEQAAAFLAQGGEG